MYVLVVLVLRWYLRWYLLLLLLLLMMMRCRAVCSDCSDCSARPMGLLRQYL